MPLYVRVRPLKLRRHPGGDGSLDRSDRTVVDRDGGLHSSSTSSQSGFVSLGLCKYHKDTKTRRNTSDNPHLLPVPKRRLSSSAKFRTTLICAGAPFVSGFCNITKRPSGATSRLPKRLRRSKRTLGFPARSCG